MLNALFNLAFNAGHSLLRVMMLMGLPACLLVRLVDLVMRGGGHLCLLGGHIGPGILRWRGDCARV